HLHLHLSPEPVLAEIREAEARTKDSQTLRSWAFIGLGFEVLDHDRCIVGDDVNGLREVDAELRVRKAELVPAGRQRDLRIGRRPEVGSVDADARPRARADLEESAGGRDLGRRLPYGRRALARRVACDQLARRFAPARRLPGWIASGLAGA